jgi:hypothetical protein
MSYKQFIQELEDDVSPIEAQSRCAVLDLFLVQFSGRHIFQLEPGSFLLFVVHFLHCRVCVVTFCMVDVETVRHFISSYLFIDMRSTSQSTSQLRRKHTLNSIRMKIGNSSLNYNIVIYYLIVFTNFLVSHLILVG